MIDQHAAYFSAGISGTAALPTGADAIASGQIGATDADVGSSDGQAASLNASAFSSNASGDPSAGGDASAPSSAGNGGSGGSGRDVSARVMNAVNSLSDPAHADRLSKMITPLVAPSDGKPDLWEAALVIGRYFNDNRLSQPDRAALVSAIGMIREYMGDIARTSTDSAAVIFGTSGWRDRIGEGFTTMNVHRVVRGIIEMMKSETFLAANGYSSFEEVKKAGIVVLRDNRFMGDEFIDAATKELVAAGVKTLIAGECPTGVGSALVTQLRAAGSINFTPSHNPMDYAGIKFNPADGGPAAPEMTSIIETKSKAFMGNDFVPADPDPLAKNALSERIDAKAIFSRFMNSSEIFDIGRTIKWLLENKLDLTILVDNMHGSSRGYIEAVLGHAVVKELSDVGALLFINTDDDVSFHGVKPEPSAENQKPLIDRLNGIGRKLTLAVALDPDADRIRFADARMDIPMNLFGAIAFANLMETGVKGGVASTAPSSSFAFEIAKQNGIPFFETPVGFKWFRPYLSSGEAMIAFEESDGISFRGHTLEKCALAGFFAALAVMMQNGQNLSDVYSRLQKRYGYFNPDRAGVDVKGVNPEDWKNYKAKVSKALESGLVKPGDMIDIGGGNKTVKAVNTIDGLKVEFDDRSWLLLRGSGTEPKFRIYFEVVSETPVNDINERMAAYKAAGSAILQRARDAVDSVKP